MRWNTETLEGKFGDGTKSNEDYEDWHRRELEFEPSDFVYLKLQPFHQLTTSNMNLLPHFLQALPGVGVAQEGGLR